MLLLLFYLLLFQPMERYTRDRRPPLPTATELGVPARARSSGLPDPDNLMLCYVTPQ